MAEGAGTIHRDRPKTMVRYLAAVVLGALLTLAALAGIVAVLSSRGTLPPPQLSNSLCLDEKLAFMRDHPPRDPNLLVVGSSVAWRHFNSPEALRADPRVRPYNAGLCGIDVAQSASVTRWLLERLPSVDQIVLIASPVDFESCASAADSRFDVEVADRYIFRGARPLDLYLEYFDPVTLLKNAVGLRHKRTDLTSFESLVINEWGDGPLEPTKARDLLYGRPLFDRSCFGALRTMAVELNRAQIPFRLALTPLNPAWTARYDRQGRIAARWRELAAAALAGTSGTLVVPACEYPEDAFFDAIHLRWSSTPHFTRSVLEQGAEAGGEGVCPTS